VTAGRRYRDRAGRHRKAVAEFRRRIVQWQVPRWVLKPGVVSQSDRSPVGHRGVAVCLQRSPATFESRLPHACGVQNAAADETRL